MDVYCTELGIRLNFGKTSEFRAGGLNPPNPPSVRHCVQHKGTCEDITQINHEMILNECEGWMSCFQMQIFVLS
jgi:hypothetical protein